MDSPAPGARVELVETQKTPKPPVVVQQIPEAERKPLRFYPTRMLKGMELGNGCYWCRPRSGNGGTG